jgi:hypothetical protein
MKSLTALVANILSGTLMCTIASGVAIAQGTRAAQPISSASAQASEKGQALFGEYMARSRGSAQGSAALEEVFANGMSRTAQNSNSLRSLLTSKLTTEEKVVVVRLLAKQYALGDPTGVNHLILQDLKSMSNSQELPLSRAATLAFSRLGYFPDYQDVLLAAKNRGVIEDDTYFGELAHVLAFAPTPDQEKLADTLQSSKNEYASQIVSMIVNNAPVASKITSVTRAKLTVYLESTEPRFNMALGQFDFVEAVRYSAWLRAVANLKASEFNMQGAEVIMAKLNDGNLDPRKVMAFLVSEFGPGLLSQIGRRTDFDPMLQRITLYSQQHPQNRDMKDIVEQVRMGLSALSS